jgi:hypothetical protein
MTFIPPRVITIAKIASASIQKPRSSPEMLLIAKAPKYKIEVRFTTTYNKSQKTAIIIATVSLYLIFKN